MDRLLIVAAAGIAISSLALAAPAQGDAFGGTPPAPATYVPPPIQWGTCDDPVLQDFGAECGMVTVPLDYTKPRGATIKLAVSRLAAHDARLAVPRRHARQPRRPGRVRSHLLGPPAVHPPRGGTVLRLDRVRPPRRRVERALAELRRHLLRLQPASRTCPTTASIENVLARQDRGLRQGLRDRRRRAARPPEDHGLGHRHGEHPQRPRGEVRSTTTASPTAPTSARSTPRCTPTGCGASSSTASSTRGGSGTTPTSTRTSPSTATSTSSSTGSPSTTASTASAPTARPIETTYYRVLRTSSRPHPQAGGSSDPPSGTTSSSAPRTTSTAGTDTATAFAAAVNDGRLLRDQGGCTTPREPGPGADNGYAIYLAVQCTDAPWPTELDARGSGTTGASTRRRPS